MSRYRSKEIVEARQLTTSNINHTETAQWADPKREQAWEYGDGVVYIETNERPRLVKQARPGDWITKRDDGALDVLTPEYFAANYEEIPAAEPTQET
jgi:hypothetical protein